MATLNNEMVDKLVNLILIARTQMILLFLNSKEDSSPFRIAIWVGYDISKYGNVCVFPAWRTCRGDFPLEHQHQHISI